MFGSYYNEGQCVIQSKEKLGSIWISGFSFAHDNEKLQQNDICAIVSGVNLHHKYPVGFENITFDLNDSQDQKVSHVFRPAFDFIEKKRKKTNVLVHCAAGISRCSVILISYLMQKYEWNLQKCLKKVQSARPCCLPNMGFMKQLQQFEKQLGLKK